MEQLTNSRSPRDICSTTSCACLWKVNVCAQNLTRTTVLYCIRTGTNMSDYSRSWRRSVPVQQKSRHMYCQELSSNFLSTPELSNLFVVWLSIVPVPRAAPLSLLPAASVLWNEKRRSIPLVRLHNSRITPSSSQSGLICMARSRNSTLH